MEQSTEECESAVEEPQVVMETFGSFYLNDCELALPVRGIQEVVIPPAVLTQMPLAPKYLLGLFNLRGTIIPVIDLKVILGLDPSDRAWEAFRIAIVDHDGINVGLLFDETGGIFKVRSDELADFDYAEDDDSQRVVCGAARLDEGERIVQILDAEAILQLDQVPQTSRQGRSAAAAYRLRQNQGIGTKCISFSIGHYRCAFQISAIHEIIKVPEIEESPLAGGLCLGMLNIRGNTVPVVDFSRVLGYGRGSRKAWGEDHRIIVMRVGSESFGLVVDRVESIVTYEDHDLLPVPKIGVEKPRMVVGCISLPDSDGILLIDHKEVLSNAEIETITRGHSEIYQAMSDSRRAKRHTGPRTTYITFGMGCRFAAAIEEVREVIEHPSELLHPPELPPRVKGMFNLRGEMVVVIDPGELSNQDDDAMLKVLIFEKKKVKYGLVVQSVESIVSFAADDKLPLPETSYAGSSHVMAAHVKEAVHVDNGMEPAFTLMILDLNVLGDVFT